MTLKKKHICSCCSFGDNFHETVHLLDMSFFAPHCVLYVVNVYLLDGIRLLNNCFMGVLAVAVAGNYVIHAAFMRLGCVLMHLTCFKKQSKLFFL